MVDCVRAGVGAAAYPGQSLSVLPSANQSVRLAVSGPGFPERAGVVVWTSFGGQAFCKRERPDCFWPKNEPAIAGGVRVESEVAARRATYMD